MYTIHTNCLIVPQSVCHSLSALPTRPHLRERKHLATLNPLMFVQILEPNLAIVTGLAAIRVCAVFLSLLVIYRQILDISV